MRVESRRRRRAAAVEPVLPDVVRGEWRLPGRAIMTNVSEPVLQALVEAAVTGTGGTDGWLLVRRGDRARSRCRIGPHAADVLGALVDADAGAAGFVLGSGQPMALSPRRRRPTRRAKVSPRSSGSRPRASCASRASPTTVSPESSRSSTRPTTQCSASTTSSWPRSSPGSRASPSRRSERTAAPPPSPDELAGELRRLVANDPNRYEVGRALIATLIASA